MKNLILVLAFVSSCGPLKMDVSHADESVEAYQMAADMIRDGQDCDDVQEFLLDTSLENTWLVIVNDDDTCSIELE